MRRVVHVLRRASAAHREERVGQIESARERPSLAWPRFLAKMDSNFGPSVPVRAGVGADRQPLLKRRGREL